MMHKYLLLADKFGVQMWSYVAQKKNKSYSIVATSIFYTQFMTLTYQLTKVNYTAAKFA